MKTWLIYNRKGGVGKTTTTANLAAGLALGNRKTLIVDTDDQANLSFCFQRKGALPAVYDYLIERDTTLTIYPTVVPNLDIITGSSEMANLDTAINERIFEVFRGYRANGDARNILDFDLTELRVEYLYPRVESLLNHAERSGYEYVLIDTPANINTAVLIAFALCSSMIIPVQCADLALDGVKQVTDSLADVLGLEEGERTFEEVCRRFDKPLHILRTMATPHWKLPARVAEEIEAQFGANVLSAQIKRSVAADEAVPLGLPVMAADPKNEVARNYADALAELTAAAEAGDQARLAAAHGASAE